MRFITNCIHRILNAMRGEQHLEKFIKRGLSVGENFNKMGGVIIDPSHCYHITIGNNVTLAPRVHVLAHDASTYLFLKKTKAKNVTIGNDVFIGASSIILPGVNIGNRVIVGAGSIVTKDIPDNVVVAGNPAHVICSIDDYLKKEKEQMCVDNTFNGFDPDTNITMRNHIVETASKYGRIFIG